jgi:hypothetical protein
MLGYCYYCGIKTTSRNREHLPPQQMFRGFRVDSLTVPSCTEHNSKKSFDDEAIIKTMLLSLEKNAVVLNNDVKLALEIVKPHYNQVKNKVSEKTIYSQNNINYDFAVLDNNVDLSNWIRKLSAGLICYKSKFYDCNNQFDQSFVFERNTYPNYETPCDLSIFGIEYNKKIEFTKIIEMGDWLTGWNDKKYIYPEAIYSFFYKFVGKRIVIKHIFYQQYTYYDIIELSEKTLLKFKVSNT